MLLQSICRGSSNDTDTHLSMKVMKSNCASMLLSFSHYVLLLITWKVCEVHYILYFLFTCRKNCGLS